MKPEALAQLFDRHAAALVLYARQWCAAAEDVVQEAFIKLARTPPPVQADLTPWLYQVVRNAAISAARAEQCRRRHEAEAARRGPAWFVPADDRRLDAAEAAAALQGLPAEQREVVIARLWGGLSFEQVAAVTSVSASAAHRHYHAGLAALRERLSRCPKTFPMTS
jgi:RNA polymerase sigma-70 factor (ECF subfamily)